MNITRETCNYNPDICKDCICPNCTNKGCNYIGCSNFDITKLCATYIDWLSPIIKSKEELENLEEFAEFLSETHKENNQAYVKDVMTKGIFNTK